MTMTCLLGWLLITSPIWIVAIMMIKTDGWRVFAHVFGWSFGIVSLVLLGIYLVQRCS
jgi:hypothetical protein